MSKTLGSNLKPRKEYFRTPILETLGEYGGKARRPKVLNAPKVLAAAEKLREDYQLKKREDYQQKDWESYCDNMRLKLVGEGLLRADFQQGVWELS